LNRAGVGGTNVGGAASGRDGGAGAGTQAGGTSGTGVSGGSGALGGAGRGENNSSGRTGSGGFGEGTSGQAGTAAANGGRSANGSGGASGRGGASGISGRAGGRSNGSSGAGGSAGQGAAGLAGQGGTAGASGAGGVTGPCDLYASGSTPCVAAHSTVRALLGAYAGKLYQVKRASDGMTQDIGVTSTGGFADAAAQDSFCSGTTCTITIVYDQSGKANHLTVAPAGGNGSADVAANATALKLTVGGHTAYAIYVAGGVGYRNNKTSGIATGSGAEGEYMVASGTHANDGCCFDYGNAETNSKDNGNGHMEAIYLGKLCWFTPCNGSGPWVMADLENGLFAGANGSNNKNTSVAYDYVTAMLKGDSSHYALKGGDGTSGALKTMYSGGLPTTSGYNPMHKEGAIILGIGGDNSKVATGTFFEGAMTSGYPSDATEDAVQANIVAAGYGH
jgi:hypothetical protein